MSELNREGLAEEFDLENIENQPSSVSIFKEEGEDPDSIIKDNIDRANRILDQVEDELANGNFSARLVEVAAKTMDSVTNAVSQIQSTVYNNDYLQLKKIFAGFILPKCKLEMTQNKTSLLPVPYTRSFSLSYMSCKAKKLGVKILSEKDFLKLVK